MLNTGKVGEILPVFIFALIFNYIFKVYLLNKSLYLSDSLDKKTGI